MAHSSIHPLRRFLIPIGLLLVMLFAGSSIAVGGSTVSTTAIAPHIPGVTPLLSYQGRLVDPATGAPKANGTYEMSFRLYTVASNGTALWTETRDVQVSNGVFSVLLGEITGLNAADFTGQGLWWPSRWGRMQRPPPVSVWPMRPMPSLPKTPPCSTDRRPRPLPPPPTPTAAQTSPAAPWPTAGGPHPGSGQRGLLHRHRRGWHRIRAGRGSVGWAEQ